MPRISDANAYRVGTSVVDKLYQGSNLIWTKPASWGSNLIVNPGFEDANIAATWANLYGTFIRDTAEKKSGAASAKHTSGAAGYGFYGGYCAIPVGATFKTSWWMKSTVANSWMQLQWRYASTMQVQTPVINPIPTTVWTYYEYVLVNPGPQAVMFPMFVPGYPTVMQIDDVECRLAA